jgi:aldehyde:ferredoxin oxidoreductase
MTFYRSTTSNTATTLKPGGSAKDVLKTYVTQNVPDGCWYGCSLACAKAADDFPLKSGPYKGDKVLVDGAEYETLAGVGSCCGIFDMHYVFECNFYCDTYGIDTISWGTTMAFLMECYESGVSSTKRLQVVLNFILATRKQP